MKIKAAVLYEMGKPRPYFESNPLLVEELELGLPSYEEVIVKNKAAGLCRWRSVTKLRLKLWNVARAFGI